MAAEAPKALIIEVQDVLRRHKKGITDEALARELPHTSATDRAAVINELLGSKRLQLFRAANNSKAVHYKEITAEEATRFKGLGHEEMLLYQTIRGAGNSGLWTKDMKARTNLPQPHITKILKSLEHRKLIKSVKNVNNPSRKVYMAFELEPSRDLTGGAWYTENQFDSAFIEALREACMRFVERRGRGGVLLREIADFIANKHFSKVELRDDDVNDIVMTLVYDGRVMQTEDLESGQDRFTALQKHEAPPTTAFTSIPCGVCPVFSDCHDDGLVSPQTCEYYNQWLSF